jgi:hypothetical protein
MVENAKLVQEIKIFQTRHYEVFKPIEGQPQQRAAKNAPKLAEQIDPDVGNIIPIIVTKDFRVIDGNTRLEACKLIEAPVRFQIIDSNDKEALELMRMMNAANQPWTIQNFIEFYANAYQMENYQNLSKFMNLTGVSIGVLHELEPALDQGVIKAGKLGEIDYATLLTKVEKLQMLHTAIGKKNMPSKLHVARALNKILKYNSVDFTKLLRKTDAFLPRIMKQAAINKIDSSMTLLSLLQKCYNYKERTRIRIYNDLE